MTSAPSPAVSRVSLPDGLPSEWAAAVAEMGRAGVPLVTRSSSLPLREAVPLLRQAVAVDFTREPDKRVSGLHAAAGVGIAPVDLLSMARRRPWASGKPREAADVVVLLHGHLVEVGATWPGLALRDGLGWALVYPPSVRGRSGPDAVAEVRPWVAAGLMAGGWLYAAAGLSPEEAVEMRAAGPVDEDRLRTLAALRGVPLPA